MKKRNLKPKLVKALDTSPVVFLEGARQTGKTTLMREVAGERGYSFVTFDDYTELALAKSDPPGYLRGIKKPVILDEVQRVPELFLCIKKEVDEQRFPGRYALTGSAHPLLIPRLGDSLAGRMEILSLYPFSQGEMEGKKEIFIEGLFAEEFDLSPHSPLASEPLWQRIEMGGYPEIQLRKGDLERRSAWCKSYITALLERDVQDLSRIEGLQAFPNLLRLLATRTSGLLNSAELSRSIGLSSSTLQRYLTLLRALFLIYLQPPWLAHRGKRIVKAPKLYLFDTGLLSFLLGLSGVGFASQPHLAGMALETFVVGEILKQQTWAPFPLQLYHFRSDSFEVDLVLEDAAGRVVGVEIKSASSVHPTDFKGLQELKKGAGEKFLRGVVLYTGERVVPFGKDFFAVPLAALWERAIPK